MKLKLKIKVGNVSIQIYWVESIECELHHKAGFIACKEGGKIHKQRIIFVTPSLKDINQT